MTNFLSSSEGLILLGFFFAFFWLPFAVGSWMVESWDMDLAHRRLQKLVHPFRHMPPGGPAMPKHA
jgi:hypothetical protein